MKTVKQINAERKAASVVEREAPGLGMVKVRRLAMRDILAFPEECNFSVQVVLASALEQDQTLMFSGAEEVEALDYGLFKALASACLAVNSLDLEAAKKG